MRKFILLLFSVVSLVYCTEEPDRVLVNNSFHHIPIVASIPNETVLSGQPAKAYFIHGEDTLSAYNLSEGVTSVPFNWDEEKTYRLVIEKGDYSFQTDFIFKELKALLVGRPLNVSLSPSLKLFISASENTTEEIFVIDLGGTGEIIIQWPDGTEETVTLPDSRSKVFTEGNYQVKIKGDLNNITSFDVFGYNAGISKINGLSQLSELQRLGLSGYYDSQLDFRGNESISYLDLFEVSPKSITLPSQHNLNTLTYTRSDGPITTKEIDYLIDNIYENSLNYNVRNGVIHFGESEDLSPATQQKVNTLKEDYGWEIEFNY
jgi:hypothetical protein